jgi:hypothetical protein
MKNTSQLLQSSQGCQEDIHCTKSYRRCSQYFEELHTFLTLCVHARTLARSLSLSLALSLSLSLSLSLVAVTTVHGALTSSVFFA